ncbi:MAG: hypothetical protein EBS53_16435, partial [Bacteroidetes bacterium]|nr:hypothetical protein [Bacteroidota bacterium]
MQTIRPATLFATGSTLGPAPVQRIAQAFAAKQCVTIDMPIRNLNRTAGAMLSGEVARRYGHAGLPEDTIRIRFAGSAGQSLGAFLAHGV